MRKTIACVCLSVVAGSFAGCVDSDRPATHPLADHSTDEVEDTGGITDPPPCAGCSIVRRFDALTSTSTRIVLAIDGVELCRRVIDPHGVVLDTCE
jgi:hypothetical protein